MQSQPNKITLFWTAYHSLSNITKSENLKCLWIEHVLKLKGQVWELSLQMLRGDNYHINVCIQCLCPEFSLQTNQEL